MADKLVTHLPPVKKRQRKSLDDLCGGLRHGLLTVIKEIEKPRVNPKSKVRWAVCLCDCGNIIERDPLALSRKSDIPKNCGCLTTKIVEERRKTATKVNPTWKCWQSMKERCKPNTKHKAKKWYSEKGISVCERWINSFDNFYKDMGERPSPDHTLDRINPRLGYYPQNCQWIIKRDQQRNKTNTVWVEFRGRKISVAELCDNLIRDKDIYRMAKAGIAGEEILLKAFQALEKKINTV